MTRRGHVLLRDLHPVQVYPNQEVMRNRWDVRAGMGAAFPYIGAVGRSGRFSEYTRRLAPAAARTWHGTDVGARAVGRFD
jgi:hypothetical protein